MSLEQKLLDSRDLPEIFKEIFKQRLTGVLFAERLKYKRSVYFQGGGAIFATSNLSEDKIGKILFTQGKITMDQLMQALDKAKQERKRLGSVLVELEFISAKDLFEAVVFQVEQVIYSLFDADWRDAKYRFDPDASFGDEVIKLSLQPFDVVLEGIRRNYSPDLIAENLGSGSAVISPLPAERFDVEKLKVSAEEKLLYKQVDGKRCIDELIKSAGVPRPQAQSFLYALRMLELVKIKSAAAAPQASAPKGPTIDLSDLDIEEPEEVLEEATLDLGDVDLPGEILEAAQAAPAPKAAAPKAPPAAKAQPAAAPRPAPQAAPQTAAPAKGMSIDELKLEAQKMRGLNYYQRLGIAADAPASAVVAAYSALRRKYEADLPQTLRPAGKAVLNLVMDAYRALAIEGNRRVYDGIMKTGGTAQEIEIKFRGRMALARFEEGKRAWESNDYGEAETAFREAIELEPARADFYFGLGLALAAQEHGAPGFQEIEALFSKAVALQSDHPRGYYYLGTVFKQRGELDRAAEAYRRALALDQRYEPAREALAACGKSA